MYLPTEINQFVDRYMFRLYVSILLTVIVDMATTAAIYIRETRSDKVDLEIIKAKGKPHRRGWKG